MTKLFYDARDLGYAEKRGDRRFRWLAELGAVELSKASRDDEGFLFGYQNGAEEYKAQVGNLPHLADRPEHREVLVRLDTVLCELAARGLNVPTPKTWILGLDDPLPTDLEFPLFMRTPTSSWKRGGEQSRVDTVEELHDEAELLRRVFGWDIPVLARQWIDFAVAGQFMFGNAPQEIRTWIVDQQPVAWSFHYMHVVPTPASFPPSDGDLHIIREMAARIGDAFQSRLVAADFIRDRFGKWWFLEAGPGAAAGTAHEAVFKFVASRLQGLRTTIGGDMLGGPL